MASAAVLVNPIYFTTNNTRSIGSGLVGGDTWSSNFTLGWTITESSGVYTYVYTFTTTGSGVSHAIIETSLNFLASDLLAGSGTAENGDPTNYGAGPSNPGIPGVVFGMKFDESGDGFGQKTVALTIKTTRVPIWGDVYAKGGSSSYIYNTGFGTDPMASTTDFTPWVPTPDTMQVIPLPAAAWAGLALIGGLVVHRVRRR